MYNERNLRLLSYFSNHFHAGRTLMVFPFRSIFFSSLKVTMVRLLQFNFSLASRRELVSLAYVSGSFML